MDNPDNPWNWSYISVNPNITWEIIRDNPNKEWDWHSISYHPNITMDIIMDNRDKPWDWMAITYNPNITWDIIIDLIDNKQDMNMFYRNPFTKQKTDFMIEEYHKHLMAYRIQYRWKNALVNPNCRIGIMKIERDMIYAGL